MAKAVKPIYWLYLFVFFIVAIWSAIDSYELGLWLLEAGMCLIGVGVLIFTYKRFPLTDVTYFFILLHLIVLLVGRITLMQGCLFSIGLVISSTWKEIIMISLGILCKALFLRLLLVRLLYGWMW